MKSQLSNVKPTVGAGVVVGVGTAVSVGTGEGVKVLDGVNVGAGVSLGGGVADGVCVAVAVGVSVGVAVGVAGVSALHPLLRTSASAPRDVARRLQNALRSIIRYLIVNSLPVRRHSIPHRPEAV
jgi:hypothetical protein